MYAAVVDDPDCAYLDSALKKYPLVVGGESFRRIIRETRAVGERIRLQQLGCSHSPAVGPNHELTKKGITKARKDENAKEPVSERMLAVQPISLSCFRTFGLS
jgi:hypothetical protein